VMRGTAPFAIPIIMYGEAGYIFPTQTQMTGNVYPGTKCSTKCKSCLFVLLLTELEAKLQSS
jgi:hypothetical protein